MVHGKIETFKECTRACLVHEAQCCLPCDSYLCVDYGRAHSRLGMCSGKPMTRMFIYFFAVPESLLQIERLAKAELSPAVLMVHRDVLIFPAPFSIDPVRNHTRNETIWCTW